jgi:ubiquinone biosynthesis protein UbiJ
VVSRHITPLAESVRDLGVSVAEALTEIRRLLQAQSAADERQLLDVLSGVMDRLAVIDHLVELTTNLEQRVAQLESDRREP